MALSYGISLSILISILPLLINADKITVAGRILCNSSYVIGDAYIELNDFDGLLPPDFMGDTIAHLENEPGKRKTFRVSGEAFDIGTNPRLEPYLRIYHGCGEFRTECMQLIPEEAPNADYFYYLGDLVLQGNKEIPAWHSCEPKWCRPMTKWQVCYPMQGKTELLKRPVKPAK
ncbi:unnamed protein product, partial [Mesorhabditis spiculigera]